MEVSLEEILELHPRFSIEKFYFYLAFLNGDSSKLKECSRSNIKQWKKGHIPMEWRLYDGLEFSGLMVNGRFSPDVPNYDNAIFLGFLAYFSGNYWSRRSDCDHLKKGKLRVEICDKYASLLSPIYKSWSVSVSPRLISYKRSRINYKLVFPWSSGWLLYCFGSKVGKPDLCAGDRFLHLDVSSFSERDSRICLGALFFAKGWTPYFGKKDVVCIRGIRKREKETDEVEYLEKISGIMEKLISKSGLTSYYVRSSLNYERTNGNRYVVPVFFFKRDILKFLIHLKGPFIVLRDLERITKE